MIDILLLIIGIAGMGMIIGRRYYLVRHGVVAVSAERTVAGLPFDLLESKATVFFNGKKWKQALQYFQEIVQQYPDRMTTPLRIMFSQTYFELKQYTAACAVYEEILAAEPTNPEHHANIAQIHTKLKAYDAAIGHLRKAVELNPESSAYMHELAAAYRLNKQHDEARAMLQKAMTLDRKRV